MKNFYKISFLIIFIFSLFFINKGYIYATRGCCSWHGGVGYCDTSVGTYVCNDGTYSPSCGCTYIAPKPVCYTPSAPEGIKFEKGTQDKTCSNYYIKAKWDYELSASGYSVKIDKNATSHPGSISDTTKNYYLFNNLTPGTYYFHIKALNNCGGSTTKHYKTTLKNEDTTINLSNNTDSNEVLIK